MKRRLIVLAIACLCLLTGCSEAVAPPRMDTEAASPVELDFDSPRYVAAHRSDFDYDRTMPLDIDYASASRQGSVAAYDLTYQSPKGGPVPATLLVPDGKGPFAGIVLMHGMPSNRQAQLPLGTFLAQTGAVVILIDAPFARPQNLGRDAVTYTEIDRVEQIQLIVDLRRAIDVLLSRPDVDPSRLGYMGVSYGAAMGGLLAGVEERLQAYVLALGDGGLVTHATGPEDVQLGEFFRLPEAQQQAWLEAMWPIEPIHYAGQAAPAALLFLNGTQDQLVPPADALRYQAAGSEPKTTIWYEAGHGLPRAALQDAVAWLQDRLATGDLLLLDPSFRPVALVVDRLLLIWLVLTLGSLAYLIYRIRRDPAASWATGLAWTLITAFFGPLALPAYRLLRLPGDHAPEQAGHQHRWRHGLGTTLWAAARTLIGGALALAILFALPVNLRDAPLVRFPLVVILPLATGLLLLHLTQRATRRSAGTRGIVRGPLWTELITTPSVLVGAYPLVIWLGEYWIATWYPLNSGPSNVAVWAGLILAAWTGAITTIPAQLWMVRSELLCYGLGAQGRVQRPGLN